MRASACAYTALLLLPACGGSVELGVVELRANLEDRLEDGSLFTPNTQSMLREKHWLDSTQKLAIRVDGQGEASLELLDGADGHVFELHKIPLRQLVPRLHYTPADPPDAFDAFNLRLAEYTRNGLSVPYGEEGDSHAHFRTDLDSPTPWIADADFNLVANPRYRPVRASVINNCLSPGLWELAAVDRAGEIYHSWFEFPLSSYAQLVGETNKVPTDFAEAALAWSTEPVRPDLDRLREVLRSHGDVPASLASASEVGFSSQSSRRKIASGFAMVGEQGELSRPRSWLDLLQEPAHLVDFVPPGKYASKARKRFDLSFLAGVQGAAVREVAASTRYRPDVEPEARDYLELEIDLGEHSLLLGNLPLGLLVPREDLVLSGFGVGVLEAESLAERRALLLERGPAPSFAYLLRQHDGQTLALNSHELGIEQVYIRTYPSADEPHWEITITSFERIVDLVKYRVHIPESLQPRLREAAERYISPIYLTYRDDNLR